MSMSQFLNRNVVEMSNCAHLKWWRLNDCWLLIIIIFFYFFCPFVCLSVCIYVCVGCFYCCLLSHICWWSCYLWLAINISVWWTANITHFDVARTNKHSNRWMSDCSKTYIFIYIFIYQYFMVCMTNRRKNNLQVHSTFAPKLLLLLLYTKINKRGRKKTEIQTFIQKLF